MPEENQSNSQDNSQQNPPQQQTGNQSVSLSEETLQRIADMSTRQAAQNVANNAQGLNNDAAGNQQQQGASGNDALLAEIQAMPEKIVNSIREAFTQPKSTDTDASNSTDNTDPANVPGKKKTFAEKWFGN